MRFYGRILPAAKSLHRRYDRYVEGGFDALADRSPCPKSVWNRIPQARRDDLIEFALEYEALTTRELAVKYTDETRRNQHGERATTVVVGMERVLYRGRWRSVEVLACPATWRPHPEQIESARRAYEDWWQALGWVRDGLVAGGMLREVELTAVMPKVRPWLARK